jgi:hypothetical protein
MMLAWVKGHLRHMLPKELRVELIEALVLLYRHGVRKRKWRNHIQSGGRRVQIARLAVKGCAHATRVRGKEPRILTGKRHHGHATGVYPGRCEIELLQVSWGAIMRKLQVGLLELHVDRPPIHHVVAIRVTFAIASRDDIGESSLEAADELVIGLLSAVSLRQNTQLASASSNQEPLCAVVNVPVAEHFSANLLADHAR